MANKRFYQNVERWSLAHPKEARMLPYGDFKGVELANQSGFLNIKTHDEGMLYDGDPVQEAEDWAKRVPLENIDVLFVYGVGLGYYYQPLKKWLKEGKNRQLVFLEDNLGVIATFFETELATEILKNCQVQLVYLPDLSDIETLEAIYWSTLMAKITFSALKKYEEKKKATFEDIKTKLAYDAALKNALLDEYLRFGAGFFRNFYPNMLKLHRSYWGNKLFGKFEKVPAIICGAGPSLEKHLALLQEYSTHALIFAGGSALNALSAKGILPHFGAGIDPNPAQYLRLSSSSAFEIPFFYRNRMHAEAFNTIKGPRLYISGSGGYDVAEWYEEKFGLESEFLDEGHNVVNFCLEVASRLGCDPIIMVGMDLAFTNLQAYASGVVDNAHVTEEELFEIKNDDEKAILRQDIYGKPIYTLWKWIAESDFISNFAKSHSNLTLINSTEGGIGFPDVKNEPFADAAKRLLNKTYDLQGRVHGEIQNSALENVTFDQLVEITEELKLSLERSVTHLEILIQEIKQLRKQKQLSEPLPVSGLAALSETELADEPAYQYILDIFNAVYARVLNRRLIQLKKSRAGSTAAIKTKLDLQLEKFTFLQNTAKANIILIDHALENAHES
ncbi:MAG: motility associated factor glycosyltransferase family protein [Parachlamydiaceae bacterium]